MAVETTKKALNQFAEANRDRFETLLREFVETPTVSAQREHDGDIKRGVDLAVETIRQLGGDAKVLKTKGNPLVLGKFDSGRNAPTVTVYNHMDVQPASRETEPWDTEPFVFTKKGDTYFGRGTTDDKGPALSALLGAVAAREAGVKANMRFLWEFEEEIGSQSFEGGIAAAMPGIATDSIIVSDTIWVARNRPACPSGLRGLAGFVMSLETAATDIHSGTTGGAARNPLGELMKLISQLYDATTGKVKVPGFYDDVVPPTKEELRDFANSGFSIRAFKTANKIKSMRTDNALDAMKRLWAAPTMEIHGVIGGYTAEGVKTVIPPRAEVKVSCRLVQNQDPNKIAKLVKDYVKKLNRDVKVEFEAAMYPYKAPTTGPLADAVKDAMRFAFGREPVFVREGGSIGAVASMEKVFKCPVMFLGLSLPEHGYHAPNENFDWQQARGGMIAFAKYFEEISRLPKVSAGR
jgi:acetylornithine deacetylase/succinyl-diaminopimelate desuccinylase-like protein